MNQYKKNPEIRWSDIDANRHLRHSVYYDWGAYVRMCYLEDRGLSMELFEKEEMGPVIFREECIFFREIMFTDKVEVDLQLKKCRRDLSRWTVIHRIYRSDETVCALLTVEGAWLDLKMRKLIKPTADIAEIFLAIPHDVGFEWEQ